MSDQPGPTKLKVRAVFPYHGKLWPYCNPGDEKEFTPAEFEQLINDRGAAAFQILPPPQAVAEPEPEKKEEEPHALDSETKAVDVGEQAGVSGEGEKPADPPASKEEPPKAPAKKAPAKRKR